MAPPGCFSHLPGYRIENKGTCKEEQTQMKGSRPPPHQPKMFSFFFWAAGGVLEMCREIKSAGR